MRLVLMMAAMVLLCGCGGKGGESAGTAGKMTDRDDCELPVPAVPEQLGSPSERSAYVVEHFWDAMDFADTLRGRNREFLERNFSNFVYLLQYSPTMAAERAVGRLMEKAEADKAAFIILAELAEKYLSEPESPMRNEDLFIFFLKCQINTDIFDDGEKIRVRSLFDIAMKNRPGMVAADFAYIDRDNKHNTLLGTKAGEYLLLIFHDPECEHCGEILDAMSGNDMLRQMVEGGRLTVLAVNVESDNLVWDATKNKLPAWWVSAYNRSGTILDKQLYSIPAYPVLYLLDRQKTVILKDASPEMIVRYLYER